MPYARKNLLTWQPGAYYHLYNRGARGLSIFRESENYIFVLRCLKQYSRQFQISIIAYCLMPNHYHLLVRQDGDTRAGLLPQRVFNRYSKAYNRRYQHEGTLFEHRFQAKPVAEEGYLLYLCRYIHANPVKDGLVSDPADWPYSNYLEWLGERNGTLVDHAFVEELFPGPDGRSNYRALVVDYLQTRRLPEEAEAFLEDLVRR